MNAKQLIEILEDLDPETEIRYMSQPSWPFEYSIGRTLYVPEDGHHFTPVTDDDDPDMDADGCRDCGGDEPDHDTFVPEGGAERVAYLLEGSQLGYGTKNAWNR